MKVSTVPVEINVLAVSAVDQSLVVLRLVLAVRISLHGIFVDVHLRQLSFLPLCISSSLSDAFHLGSVHQTAF